MNGIAPESAPYLRDLASPADESRIRRLLRQPMPGRVELALTHEPDHRRALPIAGEAVREVVIRDPSRPESLVGYGYRAVRELWLNGQACSMGYLGGLRCEPNLRAAFRVFGAALGDLMPSPPEDDPGFDLTSIMADNRPFRRIAERGLPGVPGYRPLGRMTTLTFRTKRTTTPDAGDLRRATTADWPKLCARLHEHGQNFNGYPVWSEAQLNAPSSPFPSPSDFVLIENPSQIKGCLAIWDQRAHRQVVVSCMAASFQRMRPLLNLWAHGRGRPTIPACGTILPMAFVSHAAFETEDSTTALRLIAAASNRARQRGIKLLSMGMPAEHPLLPTLIRTLKPWLSDSIIYGVGWRPDPIALDRRPIWLEVATL